MSEEQKQLIREKFETKEWNHWSSFQSKFIRLPDSTKKDIADFWLNELDLATKETERVTKERIVREMSQTIEEYRCFPDEVHCTCLQAFKEKHLEEKCGCGSPESHQLYKENKCPVKVITLIRNK